MASKRGKKAPERTKSRSPARRGLEWIGARFPAPMYVMEGGPHRPEMILWLEAPTELIVGFHIVDPKAPVSFGEVLRHTLAQPMAGPPRTPDRIRVADARMAEEARTILGDSVPVEVAPTPEIDAAFSHMQREMTSDREPTYLDDGRLPEESVRRLFEAARALYPIEPWKLVDDEQLVRVDVPALGVEGACVSIIGAMGESFGFVVFPSHLAFETFLQAMAGGISEEGGVDLGTAHLALNFEAHRDLPKTMVREVASHGWPLAAPNAYPVPMRSDRDAVPCPVEARDIDVLAAIATVLATLFDTHDREIIAKGRAVEVTATWRDGIEVRARMPYESKGAGASAHRDASGAQTEVDIDDIEVRLAQAMWRFALEKFGDAWARVRRSVKGFDDLLPFSIPWSLYRYRIEGRTLADWFLDEHENRLSDTERDWLEIQRKSWMGIWEIEDFEPGATLNLKDLLSGERRCVQEKMGSKGVSKRQALLGSVIEYRGAFLMVGTYPRLMPPMDTFQVIKEVCAAVGAVPGSVPIEKLREEETEQLLLGLWERALDEAERPSLRLPKMRNTDGDPLLFTTDHFVFEPSDRADIEHRLRELGPDVEEEERDASFTRLSVIRQELGKRAEFLPSTRLGQIEIGDSTLKIETNSVKRADRLRKRVERKCGKRLRHRAREHSDPVAALGRGDAGPSPRSEKVEPTPEMLEGLRAYKVRHYLAWIDEPLPALDGRTPREASRDTRRRGRLDALIKDMESMESRLPVAEQFDFRSLRRELSLDAK